jgi:ATP-dependent DNA ligase
VRAAVEAQRTDRLLLDGELVAFDGQQTSFSRLQQRLGITTPSPALVEAFPVVYCVFDLLEAGGKDLTGRPLVERRTQLERAIRPTPGLQISDAWHDESERRYAEACRAGWEGLIAKRADSPYTHGRSRNWPKLKCVLEQEFVIGGYTDPAGRRTDFGALLVGYYEGNRLRRPELVAQIGFAQWTADGRLRQPRFLGLRDDKHPAEVVKEQADSEDDRLSLAR